MSNGNYPEVAAEALRTPTSIAQEVLETRDYPIYALEGMSEAVGFGVPNHLNGHTDALVEYNSHLRLYIVTATMYEGPVRPLLKWGLFELLNKLQLYVPGAQLTYDEGCLPDGSDAEIEVSLTCHLVDGVPYSRQLASLLGYFEEVVQMTMPPISDYVFQKYKVTLHQDGTCSNVRPTVTVNQCIELARYGRFGRA